MKPFPLLLSSLLVLAACEPQPPVINDFIIHDLSPATTAWVDEVFMKENPNAIEHRFVVVHSEELLTDIAQIRLRLLSNEVVTATRTESRVNDGSIYWSGTIKGRADSHVKLLATDVPYLKGHVVIGDSVNLFEKAVPEEDGILYRAQIPALGVSPEADILPDVDPAAIDGVAWKGLVHSLASNAYRIARFDKAIWDKKMSELERSGTTTMRFMDDTLYHVVASAGYPKIEGEELSSVSLRSYGGKLTGGVFSRNPGAIRVTQIDDSDYYVVWKMHPDFSKKID